MGLSCGESREEVTQSVKNNGSIEIPIPTYGYLGDIQLAHGRIDICLYNDWIQQDLSELIYVAVLGGNIAERPFMFQVGGFASRYHMKYTRGVIEKGEERGGNQPNCILIW